MNRIFWKCWDCLTVYATDGYADGAANGLGCRCGGTCWEMGKVGDGGRLVREEDRCPCDTRCTYAQGPKCVCGCRGENHGTGRLVRVIIDEGPLPLPHTKPEPGAYRIAREWRTALAEAEPILEAAAGPLRERRARGEWLPREDFMFLLEIGRGLSKVRQMKSHKGRMNALAKLLATAEAAKR